MDQNTTTTTTSIKSASITTASPEDVDSDQGGSGDPAVWAAFSQNFQQVQAVLDKNRALIQQVNENHQSKVHEKMVKNVALIQEINGNISKVASMYANMSEEFSTVFGRRSGGEDGSKSGGESEVKK